MSKYSRFPSLLESKGSDQVRLSFSEIENFLGFELPASSRYPAWWSNNSFNSVMTKVWIDAGWRTQDVDVNGKELTFVRCSTGDDERKQIDDHFLDLTALSPVPLSVLKVLSRRSGRSLCGEAAHILEDALSET